MVCRISPLLKRILWPDNISITLTSAFGTFLFDNKLIVDNISNPMTSKKVHLNFVLNFIEEYEENTEKI